MSQLTLESIVNRNLFSNHYLENLIEKNHEWRMDDHVEVFYKIKKIYFGELAFIEGFNESQLEERFYRRIFNILMPNFEVQAASKHQDFPDYAFFPDNQSRENAHKEKGKESFYSGAFAVGEVKRWNVELDKFGKDKKNNSRNPSFQIWVYLHETEPNWGILSNGRKWRLYHQDKRLECYYEIDLVSLLEKDDLDGFRYFYYFFRREAFVPNEKGEIFLERVLRESADYAKEIGDNLKENVYRAMKIISDGFLNWDQNGLDISNDEVRREVQRSAMRLLYRLLFLLYAEGKGLLDLSDEIYRKSHSFNRLKKEIAERKSGPKKEYYSPASTTIWARLKDLFRLIDQGSEAFGISKEQFYVPAYNGGLFDTQKNPHLNQWTISDTYLADAIDLLARTETKEGKAFVDYSTLEIRHLGSIYEGLLEYKLKIAETDLVVTNGKKREWVTLDDYNRGKKAKKMFEDFDTFDKVKTGDIYLATDKGERKATGSYYTPDYIVNYIVENTLGPVIEKKWKDANKEQASLVESTLSINVLDPAMGSGHFLVGVVDYLATKLLKAVEKDIKSELITENGPQTLDWAKREIVSHCIYGVDLNEMAVELGKLSLWLTTISKDKPLSFLDHRLKCGNSLIGANLADLPWHPESKAVLDQKRIDIPTGFIQKLVETVDRLVSIDDDTLEHVRQKERLFEEFKETREYDMIKTLADVHTSIYFGNIIEQRVYGNYTGDAYYSTENQWKERREKGFTQKAREIAERKRFFHWELEYPEIFFDQGKQKINPGFDAVIGNPPWGADVYDKEYLTFKFSSKKGEPETHLFMTEQAMSLAKNNGYTGFITPNTWLTQIRGVFLRTTILDNYQMKKILHLRKEIFEDAPDITPVIFTIKKSIDEMDNVDICIATLDVQPVADIISRKYWLHHSIPQSLWRELPDYKFNIFRSPSVHRLCTKMESRGKRLGSHFKAIYGLRTGNNERYLVESNEHPNTHPCLVRASEIKRYELNWSGLYIINDNLISEKKGEEIFQPKIIVQYTRKLSMPIRIVSAFEKEGNFVPLNRFSYIISNDENREDTLFYLLGIMNSTTLNFYHSRTFIDYDIKPTYLNEEPIPEFNTVLKSDRKIIIENSRRIFVNSEKKNKEISGFLSWLETELEVNIEDLTNKTQIKEYYKLTFDELLKIIKKNAKKLSTNPSNRYFQENLMREYETSMNILTLLFEKIEKTDRLINQTVYKLYGLTEEEIKIVEDTLN